MSNNSGDSSYDKKLWGGRFEGGPTGDVIQFSTSIGIDWRLWEADIDGSVAHAKMLGKQGILSENDACEIVRGLGIVRKQIADALAKGENPFPNDVEDVHSFIEIQLKAAIGPTAGRLHTARSRNDQVATAFRLTLAREGEGLAKELHALQDTLLKRAKPEVETLLPGLTHFQHAQPVSLAHHLLAYFWMFQRDRERLADWMKRVRVLPLGSAALAGTSFPLDRGFVAKELGFHRPCENSLDGVSDRDFALELLSGLSLTAIHLSRMAEEFVIWSAPEHGFLELTDQVTTGSSIMPQKKNPDVSELIRGRTGRAIGALVQMATMMKGLPLSYNRDMQEDKEPVFYALDSVRASVRLTTFMLEGAIFRREKMEAALAGDFSNATDLADDLAKKGVPFREAHEIVGHVVRHCLKSKVKLEDLSLGELKNFDPRFDENSKRILLHRSVMEARTSQGGTAPVTVLRQISQAEAILAE
jgi:argininosuccinate lyase